MQFLTIAYCFAAALFASATPLIARQNVRSSAAFSYDSLQLTVVWKGYGFYQLIQADGSCLIPSVDVGIGNGTAVIAGGCGTHYWVMSLQTPTSIQYAESGFCLDAGSNPA